MISLVYKKCPTQVLQNAWDRIARKRMRRKQLIALMIETFFPYVPDWNADDWAWRIERRGNSQYAHPQNTVFLGPNQKEYRLDAVAAFQDELEKKWLLHVEMQNSPIEEREFLLREFSYVAIQLLYQQFVGDDNGLRDIEGLLSVWIVVRRYQPESEILPLDNWELFKDKKVRRPVMRWMIVLGKDAQHSPHKLVNLLYYYFIETDPEKVREGLAQFGIEEDIKEAEEMCMLSEGLLIQGREEGREEGRAEGIAKGVAQTIRKLANSYHLNLRQAFEISTQDHTDQEKEEIWNLLQKNTEQ